MRNKKVKLILAALLIGIACVFGYIQVNKASANCVVPSGAFLGKSDTEIGQIAVSYACMKFVNKEVPKVMLVRPLQSYDIGPLGLETTDYCAERPYALVVLKGNFASKRADDNLTQKYIAFVFDQKVGSLMLMKTSPNGGPFRELLSDPTLQDDPIIAAPDVMVPDDSNNGPAPSQGSTNQRTCSESSPAPTVMPPTSAR